MTATHPENRPSAIRTLEKTGNHQAACHLAIEWAKECPHDINAQITAAYACDRNGLENEAVRHYEQAWTLGVPDSEKPGFMLGFGSTLRNVGRADEAVEILSRACAEYPHDLSLRAFLSLALHSAGETGKALGTMLETALSAARPGAFGPYARALKEYKAELVD